VVAVADPWAAPIEGAPHLPPSVEACKRSRSTDGQEGWSFAYVNRTTGEAGVGLYGCSSWRCPYCAPRVFARDRDRIEAGLAAGGREWLAVTLTFDPRRWRGTWAAFRGAYPAWSRLAKRLRRAYGDVRYIAVAERHRSGWPHLHVLLRGARLLDAWREGSRQLGPFRRGGKVIYPTEPAWVRYVLRPLASECGFGTVVDGQQLDGHEACAAYLTSTQDGTLERASSSMGRRAAELVTSPGEGGKAYQLPLNAPAHFRRIRASRDLLEPHRRPGNPAVLLAIVKRPERSIAELDSYGVLCVVTGAIAARQLSIDDARRRKNRDERRVAMSTTTYPEYDP